MNKEIWKEICKKEMSVPIFSQPQWLDVVCPNKDWDVYLVGKDKNIKAALVYSIFENEKGRYIGRIPMTQNNGLWIKYPLNQGIISKQSYEEKIIDEVCDYIEGLGLYMYDQQYHYSFSNYMPFFWRYYSGVTKYTYVIEDTSDMEKVRSDYSSKLRNAIRKAENGISVCETEDLHMFYEVNKKTFVRQGMMMPFTYEFFEKLYKGCKEHNACKLLLAKDTNEQIHSVAMLVWDKMSVYYFLNGTDPELKSSQANVLLIDKGIEIAHEKGLRFDFEGSVIRGVNHAYREFGGIPKPYFRITKKFGEEL